MVTMMKMMVISFCTEKTENACGGEREEEMKYNIRRWTEGRDGLRERRMKMVMKAERERMFFFSSSFFVTVFFLPLSHRSLLFN